MTVQYDCHGQLRKLSDQTFKSNVFPYEGEQGILVGLSAHMIYLLVVFGGKKANQGDILHRESSTSFEKQ